MKPIIGIAMGDPAGVGPEVIIKSLQSFFYKSKFSPLVIGSSVVLKEMAKKLGLEIPIRSYNEIETILFDENCIHVLNVGEKPPEFVLGKSNKSCGDHSFHYVSEAIQLCRQNKIAALVTAPICKESWHIAGHKYNGHTELLAEATHTRDYRMMFATPQLNVVLVTTHLPLLEACKATTVDRVAETIILGYKEMISLIGGSPRIAVCGLNPHAGEAGLFGNEEIDRIAPAIEKARQSGIDVTGPYPSDTVFLNAINGAFDLVVALYHDQGLIPVKLLYFDRAVNVTIGLPIIRTSVDHGTAFDIAGKGVANQENMICAINHAYKLALSKSVG